MAATPGPWSFEPSDSGDSSVGLAPTPPVVFTCIPNREDRTIDIAVIGTTIYDNSEDGYPQSWGDPDANARLIAAAPELLEALQRCAELLDDYSDVNDGEDGQPVPNRAMSLLHDVEAALSKAEGTK